MRGARLALAAILLSGGVAAQAPAVQDRLLAAKRAATLAATRAAALTRQAAGERDAAVRAQAEEAALAARVAAAAADVTAAQARATLVDRLLARQRATLGAAQTPVARLLAALVSLARRPTMVAIAQPGTVDDLVHVRAVLGSTLPIVQARTAAVRADLARTRRLHAAAVLAAVALRDGRVRLEAERTALARLEAAHRARATVLGRGALSESDRALALGEQARDLVDRMAQDGAASTTASDLAAIDAPPPRPLAPGARPVRPVSGAYRLPVAGRLVTGLDEVSDAGVRARGLTFVVAPAARVVAPAAGMVRFARRFRGYGTIVILDHGDGWTSLVTGLARADVGAGMRVAAGTPLGQAGAGEDPRITVELRRRGRPVDIAALIG